ncbi:DNA mismatch repair endonuclease MutL [Salmonella enterica subsp. enterica serovar Muenchen]|nr:DNA mismatch repair endonuclease MutL [Salmonella enterica subsp. enterica serovar Muenchen]EBW7189658.1 DNA mismatch repair endonuclease MutL [Salmonella enterica subsp. enterica serovar Muenchen]EBX4462947.1 DNA mismatch repair endonuclease MutL [Salmonella enterica subsp. enterica serovar Muenchen]EBY3557581.1 DNA mismatch repair endonuclease MutL [Salmonella enterica subsp. enterica serovar Muenchen]
MTIHILSPQLANQIAAGEVVERPASIVKELLENAIDAGATDIRIDVEKGGAKCIRVSDNGSGIRKDELSLALMRHATSKISTLEDLEGIASLGFRGEALASISSVSRLTLTSRTAEQDEGWQVYAEGRDMSPVVQPASHPQGTTVEVLDLFYNTPARRRFLKSDKTESGHTEDVVRRMALSRPELGFTLTHNGKRILHCAAGKSGASAASRLAAICGKDFADRAVCLEWSHHSMQLSGWVVPPQPDGKSFDVQYFFVNGRAVRDRVIMHAVRQAYGQIPDGGQQPGYVLYLELEAEQVDVNVHPAKQEVRFHESRLVHDFICQGILSALNQNEATGLPLEETASLSVTDWLPDNRKAAGENSFVASGARSPGGHGGGYQPEGFNRQAGRAYQQLLQTPGAASSLPLSPHGSTDNACDNLMLPGTDYQLLAPVRKKYALVTDGDGIYLLSLKRVWQSLLESRLSAEGDNRPVSQPLLIPVRLKLNREERDSLRLWLPYLEQTGIRCTPDGHGVVFNGVPSLIREQPLTLLLGRLAEWLSREDAPDADAGSARVSRWLAANCEYAGVKDMAGLSVFCRQLRETPDALLEDGMLKPGLLTEIPLEEYTDMPEQNPPC